MSDDIKIERRPNPLKDYVNTIHGPIHKDKLPTIKTEDFSSQLIKITIVVAILCLIIGFYLHTKLPIHLDKYTPVINQSFGKMGKKIVVKLDNNKSIVNKINVLSSIKGSWNASSIKKTEEGYVLWLPSDIPITGIEIGQFIKLSNGIVSVYDTLGKLVFSSIV